MNRKSFSARLLRMSTLMGGKLKNIYEYVNAPDKCNFWLKQFAKLTLTDIPTLQTLHEPKVEICYLD